MFGILKFVAIVLNFVFTVILGWFASGQRWSDPEGRPAIIGFSLMAIAYVLDIALLMFG